jgi:flagellar biosynthesis protein FliR
LLESFNFIPAMKFPHLEAGWSPSAAFITQLSGAMLSIGVQLAIAPVLALLLTDLFSGLLIV